MQTVDMFKQVGLNSLIHGVEDKINAFASGEFCCGDKISITGNENDCIDLLFQRERGYIHTDFHIDLFLA